MYNVYNKTSTYGLHVLRSKKVVMCQKLMAQGGWFAEKELAIYRDQIRAIDAEIARRSAKEPLL